MDLQDNEESIEELRCKLKEIEDDYANLDFFAQQIRKERNDFQARVNLLEASQQPRNEKCEEPEEQIKRLACRVQQLEEEVSAKEKAAWDSHALIQTLESRVRDLEFEIAEKKPLYEVGVSVRARYLDKAKFVVLTPKERRGKPNQNQNLKVAGDSAAHNAIGSTDRLLFNEGVLPASDQARLLPIFTKLYTLPPTAHAQLSEKMQRVLDHEGTIRTLLVLNTALRPLAERETAMVDIAYIRSRHALLERAEFERCADVERRLARVGEMTERIVGMDHKRTAAAEQPERAGVGEAW